MQPRIARAPPHSMTGLLCQEMKSYTSVDRFCTLECSVGHLLLIQFTIQWQQNQQQQHQLLVNTKLLLTKSLHLNLFFSFVNSCFHHDLYCQAILNWYLMEIKPGKGIGSLMSRFSYHFPSLSHSNKQKLTPNSHIIAHKESCFSCNKITFSTTKTLHTAEYIHDLSHWLSNYAIYPYHGKKSW